MKDFSKKAVVTAASSFLGKELCSFLNKKGYAVIAAKHQTSIPNVYQEISADLSTIEGAEAFCMEIEKEKEVDLIINNFGPLLVKPLLETSSLELEKQFQSICFTPYTIMRRLYPLLEKRRGGFINIGLSGLHHTKANGYFPVYKNAKQTLYSFTKCFAKELAYKNIRVNMISPGYLEKTQDLPSDIKRLPLKKLVAFEEVLSVLGFLIDPLNTSITGQNIEVAGGVGL